MFFSRKTITFIVSQPFVFSLRICDAICEREEILSVFFIVKFVHEVPNTFILKDMFQIILMPNSVQTPSVNKSPDYSADLPLMSVHAG